MNKRWIKEPYGNGNGVRIREESGDYVCEVSKDDASLIAAAPELLNAAKWLVSLAVEIQVGNPNIREIAENLAEDAEKIIEKAEEKQ